jgi:hypothetical protein
MTSRCSGAVAAAVGLAALTTKVLWARSASAGDGHAGHVGAAVTVTPAARHDVSRPLAALSAGSSSLVGRPPSKPSDTGPPTTSRQPVNTAASVEQNEHGTRPAPEIVASFDGLGEAFVGPQGTAAFRNPSDNSLTVGPNHIVQIVNIARAEVPEMVFTNVKIRSGLHVTKRLGPTN